MRQYASPRCPRGRSSHRIRSTHFVRIAAGLQYAWVDHRTSLELEKERPHRIRAVHGPVLHGEQKAACAMVFDDLRPLVEHFKLHLLVY